MARAEGGLGATSGAMTLQFGLTDAGKMILRGIVFVALAALLIPAFDVLSVLVCVMLVALATGWVFRPKILITGHPPDRVIAGQTAHLTYTIKNVGRLSACNLRARFRTLPEAIEPISDARTTWRLEPGQTAEVSIAIRPKRRGLYHLRHPVCESSYPFNLFRFGMSRAGEESLIVLPAFSRLELALPCVSRHVNASSQRPAGRTGTSPEYIGSRPYQPGDSRRQIDVRAWARLSVPATKEYDDDLDNYVALVLDTRVAAGWSKGKEAQDLEAAISLCASVAYTVHQECLVDLLLAGPDLHLFTSLPKAVRLDRIHETLAVVEPAKDYTAEQLGSLLEDRLGEISEIVFVVRHWDETYQQVAQWATSAGCHGTAILLGKPDKMREDGQPMAEDGRQPSVLGPLSSGIRFLSADEVLAGRRDAL